MTYNVEVMLTQNGRVSMESWEVEAPSLEAARSKAQGMARVYERYGFNVIVGPAKPVRNK